jgi:hypothetical protein
MAQVQPEETLVRFTHPALTLALSHVTFSVPLQTLSKTLISHFFISRRKLEPMVRSWRSSIYHRLIMYGTSHDSRSRLPLLWTRSPKVSTLHDLGMYGLILNHCLSMVLLGVFAGFQLNCDKWVYWELGSFWSQGYTWNTFSGIAAHS